MSWVATVVAVVAAGASIYNTQQTAKKQDNALADQMRAQAIKQRQADQKTAQLIDHEKKLDDTGDKANAVSSFNNVIQMNKGNANRGLQATGAVSDAYKKSGSDAVLGISDAGGKFADLVASIDAPRLARERDQFTINRYGNEIDQIKRFSAGDDFLSQMRLNGIRRNPWIDAGASIANGYASGGAR